MTKMIVTLVFIGFLLGNVAFAGLWKSEAAPTRLRCEYLANPLGINGAKPNLGWMIEERGQRSEIGDRKSEVGGRRSYIP